MMDVEYKDLLDHGFVGLLDVMGTDEAIVEAARTSYQRGTKKVSDSRGLIRYLMRNQHWTPFEMCEVKFHVKAPIFVFRQWHRHRSASLNEQSARYSILDNEMYLPEPENMKPQSGTNRQGRSDQFLSDADYLAVAAAMEQINDDAYGTYQYLLGQEEQDGEIIRFPPPDAIKMRKSFVESAAVGALDKIKREKKAKGEDWVPTEQDLNEKIADYYEANGLRVTSEKFPGLARELARMVLPVSTYSQMYWKVNLRNLFGFLKLRLDPHAQKEIRVYAEAMLEMVRPIFPHACEAFDDYIMQSKTFSRVELFLIQTLLAEGWKRKRTDIEDAERFANISQMGQAEGLSKREIEEMVDWIKSAVPSYLRSDESMERLHRLEGAVPSRKGLGDVSGNPDGEAGS